MNVDFIQDDDDEFTSREEEEIHTGRTPPLTPMDLHDERQDPFRADDTPVNTPGMGPGIVFDDDASLAYALQAAEISHGSLLPRPRRPTPRPRTARAARADATESDYDDI